MTKHFFILIFVLTSSFSGNSQYYKREHVDSLFTALDNQEGIPRINTLLNLSKGYYYINLDISLAYANAAHFESQQFSYEWGYYKSFIALQKHHMRTSL